MSLWPSLLSLGLPLGLSLDLAPGLAPAGIFAASPGNQPILIAQQAQTIAVPQTVRPLPGSLDNVPVFNSNSPELIQTDGILLSTFPPGGKASPFCNAYSQPNGPVTIHA